MAKCVPFANIVQIFKAHDSPIAPDRATTIMSTLDTLNHVLFICFVRFTGKRRLYLTMLLGIFLYALVTAAYGFLMLPSGYISFDPTKYHSIDSGNRNLSYIPLISVLLWSFFSFSPMPWMLLSKLFPFKSVCSNSNKKDNIFIRIVFFLNFTFLVLDHVA